ncbi:hypothetical protein NXY56_002263 [Leishmania guyanensis]|uniref:Uncharacterized protein n=1 Tax=Leishmania guyanensis TaxID=5670 RepID=A0A1E1IT31_LEIGU|nr:hypothetical protein, unknown function [Leishmania guyanensis]
MSGVCGTAVTTAQESTLPQRSPVEREKTAPMYEFCADAGLGAAPLPKNSSSWEFLDLDVGGSLAVASGSSHSEPGSLLVCEQAPADHDGDGCHSLHAPAATGETAAASAPPPVALLPLFDDRNSRTADDTASGDVFGGAASPPKGRCRRRFGLAGLAEGRGSLARGVSTMWSLLSTTSQTHLPVALTVPRPELAATTTTTSIPNDDCILVTSATETIPSDPIGVYKHHDDAHNSLNASAVVAGTSRVDSLPSSLPPAPPNIAVPHSSYEGATEQTAYSIGATRSGSPMGTTANTILIPHVISVTTTSLTSDGEQCMGEPWWAGVWTPTLADTSTSSEHAAVASIASTLPSPSQGAPVVSEDDIRRLGEEAALREAREAAVAMVLESQLEFTGPSSTLPSPRPNAGASGGQRGAREQSALLPAWLLKPLVSLCDCQQHPCSCEENGQESEALHLPDIGRAGSAAAQSRQCEQRKAAAWISRRMSFISSSFLAIPLLPSTMAGTAFSSVATAATSTSDGASAALFSIFTVESSWFWSQACIVCASGSQRALKGLHQVCDYVWQDLKNHWYPQLRLVLGDHSSARKVRCSRHARRLLKQKRTSGNGESATATSDDASTDPTAFVPPAARGAASTSPTGTVEWRSVSSPCLFKGDVCITRESTAHQYMSWGDKTAAVATHHFHASSSTTSSSDASSPPLPQSPKDGVRLYAVMTAEAVASAAQGLLVFLL